VRTDGGRLFHKSGPQTEKARLPNWVRVLCIAAALVVVERSERSKFQGLMGKLNFQTGDALYCYRKKSFPAQLYSKTYDWIFQRVQSRVVVAMRRI